MSKNTSTQEKKRPFDTYTVTVDRVDNLTPRTKGFILRFGEGKNMSFKAGQFVQVFIPHENSERRTSYSIASPPQFTSSFELCVAIVESGVSTSYLDTLKAGNTIKVMGPLGRFTLPEPPPRDIVFVATGSGIAPFRSMINDLLHKQIPQTIYLLFGNRFEEDIIYRKEWEELAQKHPNFKVLFTLSRGEWSGTRGYVQDCIQNFAPEPAGKDFYICGLVKMIEAVTQKLTSLGVPQTQIHFERYD